MPFYVVKTPNNFFEGTGFCPSRKLARTSTGVLWCCYCGPDGGGITQIYASYSLDNGVTWTEEQVTTEVGDQESPSIAIDSLNNIHISWRGRVLGVNNIRYRRRTAGGWDAIEEVTNMSWQFAPSIAIDSLDNIHVVWIGKGWGANPTKHNVQYRQKAGGVWQAQEAITDIATSQWGDSSTIAIDTNDIVCVAWVGEGWGVNVGIRNVQYRERIAGVWQAQVNVTDLAVTQQMPSLAIDSGDNRHIAWYAETGLGAVYDLFYCERIVAVWQAPVQLTNMGGGGYDQDNPSIAIDSSGDIHIVWYGNGWGVNTGFYNLQHLKRTGGVWGAQEGLSDRPYDQYYPNLIWAFHPTVAGQKPNIVDNYLFVFTGQNDPVDERIEFFYPVAIPTVTTNPATGVI